MSSASIEPPVEDREGVLRRILVGPLRNPEQRKQAGLPAEDDVPLPMLIELNAENAGGLPGAAGRLRSIWAEHRPAGATLRPVAAAYYHVEMSVADAAALAWRDYTSADAAGRAIHRLWPDFPVRAQSTYRSAAAAASALAARRSYSALGQGITWALLDSGIEASHPHFVTYDTFGKEVARLHRSFVDDDTNEDPLTDEHGHGTHNAGIIAGGLPKELPNGLKLTVAGGMLDPLAPSESEYWPMSAEPELLAGIAPQCKLVSCKVLDAKGAGFTSAIIRALEYIRQELNDGRLLRVHGVTVSGGYEYDPQMFACGHTPMCIAVDRLVRSGVVVVAPAGNTGFGAVAARHGTTQNGLLVTINDPGNAALGITVGSTHRDAPHSYGISYFSSKGPTADGRLKPDLVAPGERIMSCAAGENLKRIRGKDAGLPTNEAIYLEQSGTSMASAYVSGAIAAFLSVHREFIGRPEEVKRIFLDTATSLDRETYFQGRGMINLLQALQAV